MRNIKSNCNEFNDMSRKVCAVQILKQNKTTVWHTLSHPWILSNKISS